MPDKKCQLHDRWNCYEDGCRGTSCDWLSEKLMKLLAEEPVPTHIYCGSCDQELKEGAHA